MNNNSAEWSIMNCVVALDPFYQSVQLTGRSCFLAREVVASFTVSPGSCCWNFHVHWLAVLERNISVNIHLLSWRHFLIFASHFKHVLTVHILRVSFQDLPFQHPILQSSQHQLKLPDYPKQGLSTGWFGIHRNLLLVEMCYTISAFMLKLYMVLSKDNFASMI